MSPWKKSLSSSVSARSNLYLKHLLKIGRSYSTKAQTLSLVQGLGVQEVLMQLKRAWQEGGSKWKIPALLWAAKTRYSSSLSVSSGLTAQISEQHQLSSFSPVGNSHLMKSPAQNSSQTDSVFQIPSTFSTIVVLVQLGTVLFLPSDP